MSSVRGACQECGNYDPGFEELKFMEMDGTC